MPETPHQPVDAVDEELVAYLDGELEPDERRRVEQRLADDRDYQRRLNELQRAWDLLDVLPRSQPDPTFTQSTVEMVALAASVDVEAQRQNDQRRRNFLVLGGVLGGVLAFIVGLGTIQAVLQAPDRQLLRDLPIIEHQSVFRNVDHLAFLELLHESGVYAESLPEPEGPLPPPPSGSADEVRSLPPADRERLRQAREQFERLSEREKDRLRQLYRELADHPRAAELWHVAVRFDESLRKLSAAERAELLSLADEEQVKRLVEIETKPQVPTLQLAGDDARLFRDWFEAFAKRREAEFLAILSHDAQSKLRLIPDGAARRRALLFAVMRSRESADSRPLPAPSRADFAELAKVLSLPARQQLEHTPDEQRGELLDRWFREAFAFRPRSPRVDERELRRFLGMLPSEKRQELERLSPEVFLSELETLYRQRNPDADRTPGPRPNRWPSDRPRWPGPVRPRN